jgi:galactokinase
MAIDRFIWIAFRERIDGRVVVESLDLNERCSWDLEPLTKGPQHWCEYIKGVAWALQEAGHRLVGWEGVVAGDVPIGAGLSSSAALELASARTFAATSGLDWHPEEMARLAQRAENAWVGVNCGLMDQMVSAAGVEGHAILLDCRAGTFGLVPIPRRVSVVVLDTGTRRGLAGSAYNERRDQCEAAARALGVASLRDASLSQLDAARGGLADVVFRRARHVIKENARTLRAAEAMRAGDVAELGRLIDASHESLRDDFQVSSAELDAMVSCARRHTACFGARMTGAGFGGCVVALVQAEARAEFVEATLAAYRSSTGLTGGAFVCAAAGGAAIEA